MNFATMHLVSNKKVSVVIREEGNSDTWSIQVIKKFDFTTRELLPAFVVSNVKLVGNPNAAEARDYAELWMTAAVIAEALDTRFRHADDLRQRVDVEVIDGKAIVKDRDDQ